MYRADGANALIQPGDQIRLMSLFTRGYCRLGVLPASPGLSGRFCDAATAGTAAPLVYTGRGLSLATGELLSATGTGCALVVSNSSTSSGGAEGGAEGSGGTGSCLGASCSGADSDMGFRTFGTPPPPVPSGPPLLPGQGRGLCVNTFDQPAPQPLIQITRVTWPHFDDCRQGLLGHLAQERQPHPH